MKRKKGNIVGYIWCIWYFLYASYSLAYHYFLTLNVWHMIEIWPWIVAHSDLITLFSRLWDCVILAKKNYQTKHLCLADYQCWPLCPTDYQNGHSGQKTIRLNPLSSKLSDWVKLSRRPSYLATWSSRYWTSQSSTESLEAAFGWKARITKTQLEERGIPVHDP